MCINVFVSAVMSEQALVHVPSSSCQGPCHKPGLHRAAMVGNSDAMAALIQGGCAVDLQDRVSGGHIQYMSEPFYTPTGKCVHAFSICGVDKMIMLCDDNTISNICLRTATLHCMRCLGMVSLTVSNCWSRQELLYTSGTR